LSTNQVKQPIFLFFIRSRRKKRLDFLLIFAFLITVLLIVFINITSLISFILFLLVSIGVYRLLFDRDIKKIVGLFVFYSLIAITLFLLQYATCPEYEGFSGPPGGIGTDDSMFFYEAVYSIPVNPFLVETSHDLHPFSKILRIIVKILPFKDTHLLDLLFFNILGVAFIPIFTSHVAYKLTEEKRIADLAYKFAMICPIIMVNGLILIREGWTAVLFIGAIYFFLTNRYILLVSVSAILFYIRIASGAQLMVLLLLFFYYKLRIYRIGHAKKALAFLAGIVVILSVSTMLFPILSDYAIKKRVIENIFFREYFVEAFMAKNVALTDKTSIFYTICTQPTYLRIPFSFVFFLGSPFLSIKNFTFNEIYIPRVILTQLFAILFLFYFKYLMQALVYIWKKRQLDIGIVAISFSLFLLILSQMSLQFRHKTMIMPLFYILSAYGFYNKTKLGRILGIGGIIFLIFIQLIVNIITII